ncbi:MAG: bifunctional isocitrate dehydrogenase kinase/phosphatase [Nannocystaceae bacterium]|nr:bifunctional isocitrate dehydrogenase kinase/phosphatase [Nannocystaceae bacterium]
MLAEKLASIIHDGFDAFYAEFMRLTRGARASFDTAQWRQLHRQSQARIDLYQRYVSRTLAALEPITGEHPHDHALWKGAHRAYAVAIAERPDVEVAETFFNAITRKIFDTVGVQPDIEFLDEFLGRPVAGRTQGSAESQIHRLHTGLGSLFEDILRHPALSLSWLDIAAEAAWLAEQFSRTGPVAEASGEFDHVEIRQALFFRAREGYIVGRVAVRESDNRLRYHPLVIAVQPSPGGMVVDALLTTTEAILPVFSSTRSYFFVDLVKPRAMVDFLASLMPELTRSELYVSIAHHRHGKSVIYRELQQHLAQSTDRFVVAPGIVGLVMTVFTLPSYRNVFKVIRDRFEKPATTRPRVLESYRAVFRGQRVGRLADTQEFEHLAFDRARFSDECLAELLDKAPNSVRVVGDRVVVDHCYIEEKMTPLNIYLQQAGEVEAQAAIVEYGDAIKELAAHDIFAGDLLWKNFGVNRSGQLVLYDYDEIQPLLDLRFRSIPAPKSWEDEMAAEPYYPVGDNDVFPEEWRPFVVPETPTSVRDAFEAAHADLLTPQFWQGMQADRRSGQLRVNLPYEARHPELAAPVRGAVDPSRPG